MATDSKSNGIKHSTFVMGGGLLLLCFVACNLPGKSPADSVPDAPSRFGITPVYAEVSPRELQRFFSPPESGGSWSASCGSIEEVSGASMVWRAPREAGSCQIEFSMEGATALSEAVVSEVEPTVSMLEGMAEPPEVPHVLRREPDGSLLVAGFTYGTISTLPPGSRHWVLSLADPPLLDHRLAYGADGTYVAAGAIGSQPVMRIKRPLSPDWETMPWPNAFHEGYPPELWARDLAVSESGRVCVAVFEPDRFTRFYCESVNEGWTLEGGFPLDSLAMGFLPTGALVVGDSLGRIFEAHGGALQAMGATVFSTLFDFVVVDEILYAWGEGVFRWDPQSGEWTDLSFGLPTGCPPSLTGLCGVSSIAIVDDELFALTDTEGLYRRAESGVFEWVADRAPGSLRDNSGGPLAVRGSELLTATVQGVWRFDALTGEWELITTGGEDSVRHATTIDFLPDGTIAFGAESHDKPKPGVYLLEPHGDHWSSLEGNLPIPVLHRLEHVALRADGSLAFATSGNGPEPGKLYFSQAATRTHAPLTLEGLPSWNRLTGETKLVGVGWTGDGQLMVAFDREGIFGLAPGAATWERVGLPLGPFVEVRRMALDADRVVVLTSEDVVELSTMDGTWTPIAEPLLPLAWKTSNRTDLAIGDDRALWVASSKGVWRLEPGGKWSPFGSGECSAIAERVLTGGGHTFCISGDRIAEMSGDRWVTIRGLGDERTARVLAVGPDGSLYLDLMIGGLVRTLRNSTAP